MTTPLRAVLEAVEQGVTTVPAIAERTGLREDVVHAAVEHLRRLNRLDTLHLRTVCGGGSCLSCDTGCSVGTLQQRSQPPAARPAT